MPKFSYDDIVKVRPQAVAEQRPGERAWVIAIFEDRPGPYFDKFPSGIVYSVEFEDGFATEIHESMLSLDE
jgi:hypothetical protein